MASPPGVAGEESEHLRELIEIRTNSSKLVPFAFLMVLLPFVPESPRWLLMQNKTEEGLEAIRRYLGKGLSKDDTAVQSEYRSIRGALFIEKESNVSFKDIITRKDRSGHLKRMLLGCGGQFMQVSNSLL